MTYVCGHNGLIYVSGVVFSEANAWSLSIEQDMNEYAVFGDAAYTNCVGLYRWSGTLSGYHEQDSKELQSYAVAGNTVGLLIYPQRSDLSTYYNGSAGINFDGGGEIGGGPVTANASFTGSGALTMTGFS
jgi:hypothetical protein